MKVRLKDNLVIIMPETSDEKTTVAAWVSDNNGHVMRVRNQAGGTLRLTDLGPRAEACREPINVTSRAPDSSVRLISNLAHTPFELDGQRYASVEAFWQGLKYPQAARRREIAELHGQAARRVGKAAAKAETITYGGQRVRVGTADHWRLMGLACRAKFQQHAAARRALLDTEPRPLAHRDSRNIPGVIMAEIWMSVRRELCESDG